MPTVRQLFAGNLDRMLRERGLTQRAFAQAIGISEPMVSKWVNGVNFPEDAVIDRICEYLKIAPVELFRDRRARGIRAFKRHRRLL